MVTGLALLVPALAGSNEPAPTPAAAHAAPEVTRPELRTLSTQVTPPPADDRRSLVAEGLKGDDYVVAQAGELAIEEAPAPEPEPEPEPAPEHTHEAESAPTESTASASGGAYTSPDGQYTYEHSIATWERLAQCESGGDWSINTGNGYYGGIQFSKSSWASVGGSGYPHEHSKWEQIHRGELLHDAQGWGAWPACSRKLGLR